MKKEFPYIVKPVNQEEYGVNYVAEYIDFLGITGGGDTQDEAIQIANEALEMYIETLELEGKEIPSATNFNSTGRITLRLPKSMHLRVIEMAEREGVSLNAYIVDALSQKLYSTSFFDEVYKKLTNEYLDKLKFINMTEKRNNLQSVFFDYPNSIKEKPLMKFSEQFSVDKLVNCKEEKNYVFSR
jgi:predicted HicB family RNase H-like nuclease